MDKVVHSRIMLLAFFLMTQAAMPLALTEQSVVCPPFGKVVLYYPNAHPSHVAIFVSGDGGWNLGVIDMARALAAQDTLVAGVDIVHYLKVLAETPGACSYPAADFEELSKFIQKELAFPAYISPVLVGYSSGATLVYATIVQAPPATFRGAISLGFCPDLLLKKPLCRGTGLEWSAGPRGKGYIFLPASHLEVPWVALQGNIDQVCNPAATADFVKNVGRAEVVQLPHVGHGFSVPRNWLPQFIQTFMRLAEREVNVPPPPQAEYIKDLPLIEVPATVERGDQMAFFVTGDGGWGVTDQGVCQGLATKGVPAVALNALKYFWERRTPESAAADLARVLRYYLLAWRKSRIALIGYSLGADVIPFMANRLPPELLGRVDLIVLLGPSRTVDFEFHLTDWVFSTSRPTDHPVLPEVEKLRGKRLLCFYGDQETDSLCRILPPGLARVIELKGGHRIKGSYSPVLNDILEEISH